MYSLHAAAGATIPAREDGTPCEGKNVQPEAFWSYYGNMRGNHPGGTTPAGPPRPGTGKETIHMTEQEMEKAVVRHHIERARRLIGDDAVVLGERLAIPLTPRGRECLRELLDEAERTL